MENAQTNEVIKEMACCPLIHGTITVVLENLPKLHGKCRGKIPTNENATFHQTKTQLKSEYRRKKRFFNEKGHFPGKVFF